MHFRNSVCTKSLISGKAYPPRSSIPPKKGGTVIPLFDMLLPGRREAAHQGNGFEHNYSQSSFEERKGLRIIPRPLGKLPQLVLLLILIARPLAAQEPCGVDFPHDSNPTAITDEDVCNFHQVDPQMYRGGRPRASAYPKLQELGVRTIINLEEAEVGEQERAVIARLNGTLKPEERIDFVSFPVSQNQIEKTGISNGDVKGLFRLIQSARKPVFIHCYYGRDRTGAVIALYRMLFNEMSYDEALDEALHYKFSSEDSGLKRTVHHYKNLQRLESLLPSVQSEAKGQ